MKIKYHNKIEIKTHDKTYIYYNNMLDSVYEKIANLQSFFDKIAFGSGKYEEISNISHLSNFEFISNLATETIQNNQANGDLYIKKIATIYPSKFNIKYLTEAGITSNLDNETNPIIYNYFSFIDNDNPNGIEIVDDNPIVISVQIYLTLSPSTNGLFVNGNNKFISFLLGEGLSGSNIYIARGEDLSSNIQISRNNSYVGEKYPCTLTSSINDGITLSFAGDLSLGETKEIVFFVENEVFARLNTFELLPEYSLTETFSPKRHYVIDLGTGVIGVESVVNNATSTQEANVNCVNYALDFASKIILPFNNMFDANTSKYISKDGDKIFFVVNEHIYGYKNTNHNIEELVSFNTQIQNIIKLVAFDNFVFIFTQSEPYVTAYFIENLSLIKCEFDLSKFENYANLANYLLCDIVQGKNGVFMLGFVAPINTTTAYTLYLNYDDSLKTFSITNYISTADYEFSYMLAFHKNNFSDAEIYYLKSGTNSSTCKRIIHKLDGTITSTYTILAYQLAYLTTHIEVKSRAVLIQKNYTPNFWIFFFPQIYRYQIDLFSDAEKYYISTNLLYVITKDVNGIFKAYNLVEYNSPTEFYKGIPANIDQNKIEHIEFLNDIVLFFMNDETEPVIAYSLKDESMCIENVSSKDDTYSVTYTKKETLGSTNKGVTATFAANIKV